MARRSMHFDTGARTDNNDAVLLCGEESFLAYKSTNMQHVNCPRCSAKHYGVVCSEIEGLTTEKADLPHKRGGTRVLMNGELIGYVHYTGSGRNGNWVICSILSTTNPKKKDVDLLGYRMEDDPDKRYPMDITADSKEEAVYRATLLYAAGRLDKLSAVVAKTVEWEARMAANEAALKAEEIEIEDRRQNEVEGLTSLIERAGALGLTNLEISALHGALARATKNS